MADKNQSMFWLKHALLALVVLLAALFVLRYNPEESQQSIKSSGQDSDTRETIEDNVSRFYQEFRMSSRDPIKEQFGDYVVPLEVNELSQTEQLADMPTPTKIPSENWQGELKYRAFAKGNTIMVEAIKYAEEEGMTLMWDLNQDFIIRQRFLTENTFLGSLNDVAGAIDANFIPKVDVYFCNRKRTVIITEQADSFVMENCKKHGFID
ncbi:TcpQ domain-containing protein [Glaciecola sp. MH2013]|uniref:TcpQ domain-containing protein n=1 Tax=Glaciecola sp. MH2013 TaxID=2785524 RepID=UPI00189E9F05|nr:TcpQ domain-containing protein [Glaciecola sp. MH2013]MBF7072140.1 TcpQ domain-containing protein [Glaciecola sp. MH2013]